MFHYHLIQEDATLVAVSEDGTSFTVHIYYDGTDGLFFAEDVPHSVVNANIIIALNGDGDNALYEEANKLYKDHNDMNPLLRFIP